ncbi:uncharacterized protein QC763_705540 [Podospora pseudopauciseta]|uniref:Uncharacterized protein n=1 Tax=Podospora pseudopauciseta TaxID=2093780 RepID=A0ABR0H0K5_9PEZI|nr:hypothetical protein QC763_705540 [Podospora pseudopauciseta]
MKRIVLSEVDESKTNPSSSSPEQRPPRDQMPSKEQRQLLPQEVMDIVVPSLKVGGSAGACGLFMGGAAGILRGAPPVFFSLVAGGQWFALGSSYWAARLVAFNALGGEDKITPGDKLKGSTFAGAVSGVVGGSIRGPRNIIPGAIVCSLLGAGGQAFANRREAKQKEAEKDPSKNKRFWHSSWSPITALSDQDYVNLLEEKLLRVEADIALIDDRIRELREADSKKMGNTPPPTEQVPLIKEVKEATDNIPIQADKKGQSQSWWRW